MRRAWRAAPQLHVVREMLTNKKANGKQSPHTIESHVLHKYFIYKKKIHHKATLFHPDIPSKNKSLTSHTGMHFILLECNIMANINLQEVRMFLFVCFVLFLTVLNQLNRTWFPSLFYFVNPIFKEVVFQT